MDKALGNYKFRINSPEQSERLQNVLFEMGYVWADSSTDVCLTNKQFLFAGDDSGISCCQSLDFFLEQPHEELDTEAFIAGFTTKPYATDWQENTGVMPVAGDVLVDVKFRDGCVEYNYPADDWFWKSDADGLECDIVKWRLSKVNTEQPTAVQSKIISVEELVNNVGQHLCIKEQPVNASSILQKARECLDNRATERDHEANGERSMKRCVESFNALTGHTLSVTDGWIFMGILKLARSLGGAYREDDYIDAAAYMALAGEEGAAK